MSPAPATPLHIAIDARIINSSTGTLVVQLLEHLQQIDMVNRYTVMLDPKDVDYWRPTAANFTVALIAAPHYSFAEQFGFRRMLARLAPDLVHFCMPQQPLFFYRFRKVTSFHDLTTLRIRNPHLSAVTFRVKNLIGQVAFRLAARESARIVCCSTYTRDDVVRTLGVDPARVSVIYPAGDAQCGELMAVEHGFGRYLLYVGSHFDYKNLKRLCDAHQRLLADHPDLGLIFVGRPDRESQFTRNYVAERGYCNITFMGYLPDPQRDWLYVHAAAYVFPSLSEGFGLPGLEAMSYGTPVVSSNATCLPEIYGDAALYFDPHRSDDMAAAIGRVLADPTLRAELIDRGHERVARYSWRRMAEELLATYQEVGEAVRRQR